MIFFKKIFVEKEFKKKNFKFLEKFNWGKIFLEIFFEKNFFGEYFSQNFFPLAPVGQQTAPGQICRPAPGQYIIHIPFVLIPHYTSFFKTKVSSVKYINDMRDNEQYLIYK